LFNRAVRDIASSTSLVNNCERNPDISGS